IRGGFGPVVVPVPAGGPTAQEASGDQVAQQWGAGRAEAVLVCFGQWHFSSRCAQVRGQYVGVLRVEGGGFHIGFEDGFGVVHQVGVQGVVAGDEDRQPIGPGAARAPDLLPQRDAGAGPSGDQYGVQAGDVHAQFEGVGAGHGEQFATAQGLFECAAFFGQVPAAVGGHGLMGGGAGGAELVAGLVGDRLGAHPGADERQGAHSPAHQVGEQVGAFGQGRAPGRVRDARRQRGGGFLGPAQVLGPGQDRGLPQRHGGAPARGAAGGDRGDVLGVHAEQAGGAVFGGAGGGRGQDGTGGAAVMGG